jgi:hypothetical protein
MASDLKGSSKGWVSQAHSPQMLRTECSRTCRSSVTTQSLGAKTGWQWQVTWNFYDIFFFCKATQVKSQGIINNDNCHLRTKGWPDSLPPTPSSMNANERWKRNTPGERPGPFLPNFHLLSTGHSLTMHLLCANTTGMMWEERQPGEQPKVLSLLK